MTGLLERVRRAIDGNPFDPDDDPDSYRRWDAASAVHSGPSTVSIVHMTAASLPAARRRHAAFEGIDI